jgi:hypothetical protein
MPVIQSDDPDKAYGKLARSRHAFIGAARCVPLARADGPLVAFPVAPSNGGVFGGVELF